MEIDFRVGFCKMIFFRYLRLTFLLGQFFRCMAMNSSYSPNRNGISTRSSSNHDVWRLSLNYEDLGKTRLTTYNHDGWKLGLRYKIQKQYGKKDSKHPPLLLIHPVGIGLSSWFWEPFMESWSYSDIFCPDLIGCGLIGDKWDPNERGLFFPLDWVRQCETLIHDILNSQPCVVMTQGGLAPVGILLAKRNPSSVKQLILCSPPTWNELTKALGQTELKRNYDLLRSEYGELAFSFLEQKWAIKFFSDLFLFEGEADSIWIELAFAECTAANRSAVAVFNAGLLQHRSYKEELKELSQPTLILTGNEDKRQRGRIPYARNMMNCRLRSVPGCNVLPWESTDFVLHITEHFSSENKL